MRHLSRTRERGTGMGEVLVYVGGVALVWFIGYLILNWVYTTKEARVQRQYEAYLKKHQVNQAEFLRSGPGTYQITCWAFFPSSCREKSKTQDVSS